MGVTSLDVEAADDPVRAGQGAAGIPHHMTLAAITTAARAMSAISATTTSRGRGSRPTRASACAIAQHQPHPVRPKQTSIGSAHRPARSALKAAVCRRLVPMVEPSWITSHHSPTGHIDPHRIKLVGY